MGSYLLGSIVETGRGGVLRRNKGVVSVNNSATLAFNLSRAWSAFFHLGHPRPVQLNSTHIS